VNVGWWHPVLAEVVHSGFLAHVFTWTSALSGIQLCVQLIGLVYMPCFTILSRNSHPIEALSCCGKTQVLTAFAACLKLGGLVGAAAEFVTTAPALPTAEQLASLTRIQRRQLARGKSASEKPPSAGKRVGGRVLKRASITRSLK
jgi:hypothetical protein